MAGLRRRLNGALAARISREAPVHPVGRRRPATSDSPRLGQLLLGTAALAAAGWMAVATATVVLDRVAADAAATQRGGDPRGLPDAARGARRRARPARRRGPLGAGALPAWRWSRSAGSRRRSCSRSRSGASSPARSTLMRARLQEAVAAARHRRRPPTTGCWRRWTRSSATLDREGASGDDLAATLRDRLRRAGRGGGRPRHRERRARRARPSELAELELRCGVNAQRQDEMVDELEQAVAMSFGPLEKLLRRSPSSTSTT